MDYVKSIAYDNQGRVIEEETHYRFPQHSSRRVLLYEGEKLVAEEFFHPADKFSGKIFYNYDKKGKLLLCRLINKNGDLGWCTEYTYDDLGNKTVEKHINYAIGDTFTSYYKYDRKNYLRVYKSHSNYHGNIKVLYEYNKKGKLVNKTNFFDNELDKTIHYTYNRKGLVTRIDYVNPLNKNRNYDLYFYTPRGIKRSFESTDDDLGVEIYNEEGNLQRIEEYQGDIQIGVKEFVYNKSGLLINFTASEYDYKIEPRQKIIWSAMIIEYII
ncbi:MAG: hypothetical protein ACPL28_12280 [bacterium]